MFLTILLTLVTLVILNIQHRFNYWKSRGVPFIKPLFPIGNVGIPFVSKTGLGIQIKNIYDQCKQQDSDYVGFYVLTTPALLAVHPEFVKQVLTTKANHFTCQGTSVDEKIDPLSANILTMEGDKWKEIRAKLSPSFSPGKIKLMFEHIVDCGNKLKEHVNTISDKPINIKIIMEYYAVNVITSCMFGLECSTNVQEIDFIDAGRRAFGVTPRLILWFFLSIAAPFVIKLTKLKLLPDNITVPFLNMTRDVIKTRKMYGITRNDLVQNLSKGEHGFTSEEITAQAIGFFIASFESTTLTLTYCMYEFARHHEIQDKIRKEIADITRKHDGILTFEAIMEMKYLEQVIRETLRYYDPVPYIRRICTEDFVLPNNTVLEKGTSVFVSTLGLQHDDKYFENPEEYRPERFSDENKENIHPFTYLPFGEGPRTCIGYKLGMVQLKVALVSLLTDYIVNPYEGTKYPMEFNSHSFIQGPKHAVILNLNKVQK